MSPVLKIKSCINMGSTKGEEFNGRSLPTISSESRICLVVCCCSNNIQMKNYILRSDKCVLTF